MISIRRILTLCLVAGLFPACGGGGGTDGGGTAAIRGAVLEVEGQTVDRSGVRVTVLETGQTSVTASDGRFNFDAVPAGTVTLSFLGPTLVTAPQGDDDNGNDDNGGDDNGDDDNGGDDNGGDDNGDDDDGDDDNDDDEFEDVRGRILTVRNGEEIEVRCRLRDGRVETITVVRDGEREVKERLELVSKTAFVDGEIEIESESDGDQKIEIEVEDLPSGEVIEILMSDPQDPATLVLLYSIAADQEGEAEIEIETNDGDTLPFGVASLSELEGLTIEIRRASDGEVLLRGEFPALPDGLSEPGDEAGSNERGRGRAELRRQVPNVEGHVEIRSRPEKGDERFKMEAEDLASGTTAVFQIEDPDNAGTFITLGSIAADGEGEAELNTQDGFPLPLGVSSVADLVGLDVRVTDTSGQVLLIGSIPPLLAD